MDASHSKFVTFGLVGNLDSRKRIVEELNRNLFSGGNSSLQLNAEQTEHFADSIRKVTSHPTMLELTREDAELATQVGHEILGFVNSTKRRIVTEEKPHEFEYGLLEDLAALQPAGYPEAWDSIAALLEKSYNQREIDPKFYTEQFANSLLPPTKGKNQRSFESVRDHLTEKWQALLTKKDLAWQLDIIEQERAKFVKDLYARIEELKKLKDALQPFTDQLGRLWDMSRGNLHKLNFDLLRQYADLLQRSEVLQQLAEMLGRMRKAETELEEETYRDIEFKTVWRVDHAQKAELVGVREGDDLNHLLPGETALLSDPELEMLFYKRFVEKRLQIYEFQGRAMDVEEEEVERQRLKSKEDKKGPIIICVDTSGSMHGAPEQVAKVLCFALLKIALNENRKCYLINFSTRIHTLDLTEFRNSLPLLLDFLGMSFHGGTDVEPALEESLRMIKTDSYRKSDVLVISDFVIPSMSKGMVDSIASAKEAQTKFHSLVIGHSANAGVVKEFDHNWHYDPAHPESLKRVLKELGGM